MTAPLTDAAKAELLRMLEDFLEFAERAERENPRDSAGRKRYLAALKYYWLGVCDTYRRCEDLWPEFPLFPLVAELSGPDAIARAQACVEAIRAERIEVRGQLDPTRLQELENAMRASRAEIIRQPEESEA